ncbi:hypothetical protein NQ318_018273 [Aromia moschata]|uniref:Uncharacterized protein n=1 Tax=Aromia moschata TaxID=1265417 RepID=A0AAV8ZF44_9CUCU|nr:hypothetical protein NQ318_018273 [Aromia moschata]
MLTSGREMKLPTDLMLGRPLEETEERFLPEFVEDLRERMDRIHRFSREKLKIHSDKMKQRLDTTSTETAFKPVVRPKKDERKKSKASEQLVRPVHHNKENQRPGLPYPAVTVSYRIELSPRSKPKMVHLERLAKLHRT